MIALLLFVLTIAAIVWLVSAVVSGAAAVAPGGLLGLLVVIGLILLLTR